MAASKSAIELHYEKSIRDKKIDIKLYKRSSDFEADELLKKQGELDILYEKYIEVSDGRGYTDETKFMVDEFCDEYFYDFDMDDRDDFTVGRFYDLDASLYIVGKEKKLGKSEIIQSLLVGSFIVFISFTSCASLVLRFGVHLVDRKCLKA
jgi:hypothetical protein